MSTTSLPSEDASGPILHLLKKSRLKRLALLFWTGLRNMSVLDLIRLNYARPRRPMQITFGGRPLRISDAEGFIEGYREIFQRGIYHFRCDSTEPLVIDAGANVGLTTIFFKQIYPESRVILFEPDRELFALLRQNIATYGLEKIEAINAAVWKTDGHLPFVSEGGLSGHIASRADEVPEQMRVASVRLKRFLDRRIDLLKMDIEGAEFEVLQDCRDELRHIENLFIEYHSAADSEQQLARILQILSGAGFRYHVHEAFTSPRPFLRRNLCGRMDLQLNVFAMREG